MSGSSTNTVGRRNSVARRLWLALIWGIGLLPLLEAISSPRIFDEDNYFATLNTHASLAGMWTGRVITAVTLGLGGVCLGMGLTRKRFPRHGLLLWASSMLLAAGPLLSSYLGSHPRFFPALLAAPVMFSAIWLLPRVDFNWLTTHIRRLLLVYVYGSFASIVIAPTWALEMPYDESYVPGFRIRLHGIAVHANNLSLLLAFYLILDWFQPRQRTRWDLVNSIAASTALILTQSKTVVAIVLLVISLRGAAITLRVYPRIRALALAFAGLAATCTVALALVRVDWDHLRRLFIIGESPLFTLTGRTLIWAYTVLVWSKNPLFGYGPSLWDADMRMRAMSITHFAAPHAHNQFFETLGEAGIVGIIGLILYSFALLKAAHGARKNVGSAAYAMVWVLMLRGISEPFFRPVMGDPNFYVHTLTFALVLLTSRTVATSSASGVGPAGQQSRRSSLGRSVLGSRT